MLTLFDPPFCFFALLSPSPPAETIVVSAPRPDCSLGTGFAQLLPQNKRQSMPSNKALANAASWAEQGAKIATQKWPGSCLLNAAASNCVLFFAPSRKRKGRRQIRQQNKGSSTFSLVLHSQYCKLHCAPFRACYCHPGLKYTF